MTTLANQKTIKLYAAKIKSVDHDNKSIRFQVSDDSVDRYGERVDQQSWNIENFTKNSVGLWNHRSGDDMEPEDVLANWSDFETEDSKSFATATFDQDNPKAMFVFGQYVRGFLRAVSVGFIPHTLEFEEDVPVLKDCDLLEISFVAIPANANAMALAYKSGEFARKDALWMERSMRDAADILQEQLTKNAPTAGEETHVEEVKDQIKALTDLVTSMSEQFTTLNTTVETVVADVTEVKIAVAELKPADVADPAGSSNTPDPAKGGDTDQPGAAAEELDEDAELTDEMKAQIDAEFDAPSGDTTDQNE